MTNTESKKKMSINIKVTIALVLGIVIAYFFITQAVNERLDNLQLETKLLISEQETRLATIAETTARNGADSVTERIIRDCSLAERTQFDELLSNLNRGLSQAQLVELDRLFGRCGSFFSERKAVMVSRFEREIEIYQTFVAQLENITNDDLATEYKSAEWRQLADLEAKQSELFSDLVIQQDQIITALLAGNAPGSEEVVEILQSVNQTQETLVVTKSQASTLRASLVSL